MGNTTEQLAGFPYARGKVIPAQGSEEKNILLVMLHGSGTDEHNLVEVGDEMARRARDQGCKRGITVVSLRAPLHNDFGPGYKWFMGFSPFPAPEALTDNIPDVVEKLRLFFEQAPDYFDTAPDQQFIAGFSQGATIAWSMAIAGMRKGYAHLQPKCIIMCGRLMPEFGSASTRLGKLGMQQKEWNQECKTAIQVTFGTFDDILPRQMAIDSVRLGEKLLDRQFDVAEANSSPTSFSWREVKCGHEITPDMCSSAAGFINMNHARD